MNIIRIVFSFDRLKILGVMQDRVYLKGELWTRRIDGQEPDDFEEHECVLVIKRPLFKKTLDYWLDDKKVYCEYSNSFCGAMGTLLATDFEERPESDRCHLYTETNEMDGAGQKIWKHLRVRTFVVSAFDPHTNMEHG